VLCEERASARLPCAERVCADVRRADVRSPYGGRPPGVRLTSGRRGERSMPATIHRIGEPENASEAKAIRKLAEMLPENFFIFHNLEITTGSGLPYEYDVIVVGEFAVYHVEVKGYHGAIRGNQMQWVFENGGVMPSPIPLANKKTKILASKLRNHSHQLADVWTETVILLTDDGAKVSVKDDQAHRIVLLGEAFDALTDPKRLPVSVSSIRRWHDPI